jgi:hypothetical protein
MRNCCLMGRFAGGSVIALLVILVCGCGPSGGPTTNPVSGPVTIGGQAAKEIRVDFHPVDQTAEVASGNVEADGRYTLYTGQMGKPGAMAGRYKVVLTPMASGDDSYMRGPQAGRPQAGDDGIPKEYKSLATTPKEVEVKAGRNTIDIEI